MNTKDTFLYHDDLKQKYIDTVTGDVKIVFKSRVTILDKYEQEFGKDMLDWSVDDFSTFFKNLKYRSASSLSSYKGFICRLGTYLANELNRDASVIKQIDETYDLTKLEEFIDKEKSKNQLITVYDYEKIIENNPRGSYRFVPIEQLMFIFFWHDVVKTANDLFTYKKDDVNFKDRTLTRYDGSVVQLNEKEMDVINKFINGQESPVEVFKKRTKERSYLGEIEMNDETTLYVIPESTYLVHPIVGCLHTAANKPEPEARFKSKPNISKFGVGRILEIVEQINEKLDIDFRPMTIVRSGEYYRIIMDRKLKGNKDIKNLSKRELFLDCKGHRGTYEKEELAYVLSEMNRHQLEEKYGNKTK